MAIPKEERFWLSQCYQTGFFSAKLLKPTCIKDKIKLKLKLNSKTIGGFICNIRITAVAFAGFKKNSSGQMRQLYGQPRPQGALSCF